MRIAVVGSWTESAFSRRDAASSLQSVLLRMAARKPRSPNIHLWHRDPRSIPASTQATHRATWAPCQNHRKPHPLRTVCLQALEPGLQRESQNSWVIPDLFKHMTQLQQARKAEPSLLSCSETASRSCSCHLDQCATKHTAADSGPYLSLSPQLHPTSPNCGSSSYADVV